MSNLIAIPIFHASHPVHMQEDKQSTRKFAHAQSSTLVATEVGEALSFPCTNGGALNNAHRNTPTAQSGSETAQRDPRARMQTHLHLVKERTSSRVLESRWCDALRILSHSTSYSRFTAWPSQPFPSCGLGTDISCKKSLPPALP